MCAVRVPPPATLTQAYVRDLFDYELETGRLLWRVRRPGLGGRTIVGGEAGRVRKEDGYVFVGIDGQSYMAQNIIWLWMTGELPADLVDHKNRQRADNRWENLRPATWVQNCQNKSLRSDNLSGITGVSFDKARGKWAARIKVGDKYVALGRFITLEAAAEARRAAELQHFGEFAPA